MRIFFFFFNHIWGLQDFFPSGGQVHQQNWSLTHIQKLNWSYWWLCCWLKIKNSFFYVVIVKLTTLFYHLIQVSLALFKFLSVKKNTSEKFKGNAITAGEDLCNICLTTYGSTHMPHLLSCNPSLNIVTYVYTIFQPWKTDFPSQAHQQADRCAFLHNTVTRQQAVSVSKCHISAFISWSSNWHLSKFRTVQSVMCLRPLTLFTE